MLSTHEITNQVPPLENYNLYTSDKALGEAVAREHADWAASHLRDLGSLLTTPEVQRWGFLANQNKPVLKTHNRFGERIDEVEFHPAWHHLFELSVRHGLHTSPWRDPRAGAQVARAAAMYLAYQNEQGHICPVTMTYGSVQTLKREPSVFAQWQKALFSTTYDGRFLPLEKKNGALIGMAMTEKQGGSDVRTNTTQAQPIAGREYLLTGHKWFCSAPMNDAFLVLAVAPKGMSCFLVPRWKPDGTRNNFFIQRLKDKMGDQSNASSEIEFAQTWAHMIGEEGRGVPIIIEMAQYTRLDCAIAAASLMRQSCTQALHHAHHRHAFGKALIDQPLMAATLADLCLESEAATMLAMRTARAYDAHDKDDVEVPFRRITTAIAKFWLTRRSILHAAEGLEVLGGNGVVEEFLMPRLYRQAPINSVWEGSGNVMCLDVLRAMTKEPRTGEVLMGEIEAGAKLHPKLSALNSELHAKLKHPTALEPHARRLVAQLAVALQASLLVRFGDSHVAEAFCENRLQGQWGLGMMEKEVNVEYLLARTWG